MRLLTGCVLLFLDMESHLQGWVTDISKKLFGEDRNLQSVTATVEGIKEHDRSFQNQLSGIRGLITDIRGKLSAAKRELRLVVSFHFVPICTSLCVLYRSWLPKGFLNGFAGNKT